MDVARRRLGGVPVGLDRRGRQPVVLGEDTFPRAALEYLDDWAADDKGFLRKYYPPDSDEPQVFARRYGEGRVVYFPWDIDRTFWEVLCVDFVGRDGVRDATARPLPRRGDEQDGGRLVDRGRLDVGLDADPRAELFGEVSHG